MSLRTHQPFESRARAVADNQDILSRVNVVSARPARVLVEDTDEGAAMREQVTDLRRLISAYQDGSLKEQPQEEDIW